MSIVSFALQKGGVGKTTASLNFASFLAMRGQRTLLIDCDMQGNATKTLLPQPEPPDTMPQLERTLKDVVESPASVREVIIPTTVPDLDIIPNDIRYATVEWKLMSSIDNTHQFHNIIQRNNLLNDYEHIIMDAPPGLNITMLNVLCASQYVMIPVAPESYSFDGLANFLDTLCQIRGRSNPDVRILGAFLNNYEPRMNLHQGLESDLVDFFGDVLFKTRVRRSIKISEANTKGLPIFLYAKKSYGANDMGALFTEALERMDTFLVPDMISQYQKMLQGALPAQEVKHE